MPTNDFLPFGSAAGANVMTQADYVALAARLSGFSSGTANSAQLNKAWRQSSIMAAMLAQFIVDQSGQNAVDDGTTATLEANLLTAIRAAGRQATILADTGATANVYAAANTPALSALPATGYSQRLNVAHANTGASTYAPDGLAAKPIYGLGLQPLQGGELPVGIVVLMYLVQAGVNGGNGAWIIIESLGGASQVAPATQSLHAMQLGQAVGRLLNVQVFSTPGTFTYTQTPGTNKVIPKVQAAGGAAGGAAATGAGVASLGAPGTCGAYAESLITSAFSGVTITVGSGGIGVSGGPGGNGGPSSFGALISCPGGTGGGVAGPSAGTFEVTSGNSPTPSGGNLVSGAGKGGSLTLSTAPTAIFLGASADTLFGAGPKGGSPGVSPGTGGGPTGNTPSSGAKTGPNGANGIILVYEYA